MFLEYLELINSLGWSLSITPDVATYGLHSFQDDPGNYGYMFTIRITTN